MLLELSPSPAKQGQMLNINVTFHEVTFSSEEENVEVPDELDFAKGEERRTEAKPLTMLEIKEKIMTKKKEYR